MHAFEQGSPRPPCRKSLVESMASIFFHFYMSWRARAILARKLAVICLMAHRRRRRRHTHHRCLSSSVGRSLSATISGCWKEEKERGGHGVFETNLGR